MFTEIVCHTADHIRDTVPQVALAITIKIDRIAAIAAGDELRHAQEARDPFEIAIIDMQMPDMDGEELGLRIKQDPDLADTILIMVSSMGARGDVARLKKIGFGAYLTKPIKQSQLYDCLATTAKIWKEKKQPQDATIVTRHSLADNKKQGIRILLAEDDATNQKVALHILKKFGYRADAVENGQGVLEALEKIPYDVVLMDVQMPEMDGLDVCRTLRQEWSVPIIMLTARSDEVDRVVGLEMGAAVIIGLLAGIYIDKHFHTDPWFTLIFIIFGVLAGFRNIYLALKKSQKL